jgi:MFS family permease
MSNPSIAAAPASKMPVLVAVCLAGIILPLSFVSGSIATPVISRELGGSAQALSWITNAFMLSFGCFLMAAGSLADEVGRKKVFISGVSLFALLSGLIGFSSSLLWIDVMRALQGVAAAAALAGGSASLAQEFEGRAQMRAFSMLGSSFGIGLAFGPSAGGRCFSPQWLSLCCRCRLASLACANQKTLMQRASTGPVRCFLPLCWRC